MADPRKVTCSCSVLNKGGGHTRSCSVESEGKDE